MTADEELERRFAEAEAAIGELRGQYREWVIEAVGQCMEHASFVEQTGGDGETLQAVFNIAHDVKGTSGGVGYQLVTDVADSLCRVLRGRRPPLDETPRAVVLAHMKALDHVVRNDIAGDGGEQGQRLVQELARLRGLVCDDEED